MNLIIDNYDSFSYNVYQLAGSIDPDIRVVRNDELTVDEVRDIAPSHIIISPGPGRPADAGISEASLRNWRARYQSSEYASDIRRYVNHLAHLSPMLRCSCMVRVRG